MLTAFVLPGACGRVFVAPTETTAAVADAGGIEVVVAAMQRHAGNSDLQETGCWVLQHVASGNTGAWHTRDVLLLCAACSSTRAYARNGG